MYSRNINREDGGDFGHLMVLEWRRREGKNALPVSVRPVTWQK